MTVNANCQVLTYIKAPHKKYELGDAKSLFKVRFKPAPCVFATIKRKASLSLDHDPPHLVRSLKTELYINYGINVNEQTRKDMNLAHNNTD